MKRFAALGAVATISLLMGCATGGGYYGYSGAYGYGGYPAYAYDYGYAPYYDGYGYPYAYGPSVGLGFSYYDRGGFRGRQHAGGFSRPRGPG
jgi:hypothetical protein